jgi:hypothetical protein
VNVDEERREEMKDDENKKREKSTPFCGNRGCCIE